MRVGSVQPAVPTRIAMPASSPPEPGGNRTGAAYPPAAVIAAVMLLGFTAWWAVHGIGPFQGQVVGQTLAAGHSTVVLTLRVTNQGSRQGRARCQVTGVAPNGQLRSSGVQLSPVVAPRGSVEFDLPVADLGDSHDMQTTCA